ncbi:hypothetical protein CK203_046131 [Vitis vinifera]|uniref:Uncharacterized protein n=1 Tax=Vitis vinifera TaxID=29760 RepID=A0A438HP42_VITVI|nr:hypothetical protein CK203_046131 [Vitis vinifera]
MGIPHSGRKLIVDKGIVKASPMPSLKDIEALMVDIDDIEDFKWVFLIFACATLLAPTSHLEAMYVELTTPHVAAWYDFLVKQCIKLELEMLEGFGKVEVIFARMETTGHQITDAQSHVNSLIASYNRDMNVLRTPFTSLHYRTDEGQSSSSHEHVNESGAPFYTNNAQHLPIHSHGQRTSFEGGLGCTNERVSKDPM